MWQQNLYDDYQYFLCVRICIQKSTSKYSFYPNNPGLCRVSVCSKRWKSSTVHGSLCVSTEVALLLSGLIICGSLNVTKMSVENWGKRNRPRWRVTVFLASSLNLATHCVPVSIHVVLQSDKATSDLDKGTKCVTSKAPDAKALLLLAISSKWYLAASWSSTCSWYSTSSTIRLWSVCGWVNTSWLSGISLSSLMSVALEGITAERAPPNSGRVWAALPPAHSMGSSEKNQNATPSTLTTSNKQHESYMYVDLIDNVIRSSKDGFPKKFFFFLHVILARVTLLPPTGRDAIKLDSGPTSTDTF